MNDFERNQRAMRFFKDLLYTESNGKVYRHLFVAGAMVMGYFAVVSRQSMIRAHRANGFIVPEENSRPIGFRPE